MHNGSRSGQEILIQKRLSKSWRQIAVVALAALAVPTSNAADVQIVEVKAGETADAYFSINLKGKVFVKVAAKPGEEACVDFWWIKWPWGSIEHLGRHCNSAAFEIPSLFALTFSSKLRVGGARNAVKLAVSSTEQVASSYTLTF